MATRTTEWVCGSSSIFSPLSLVPSLAPTPCHPVAYGTSLPWCPPGTLHLAGPNPACGLPLTPLLLPKLRHPPTILSFPPLAFPLHVTRPVGFTSGMYPVTSSMATTGVPATISSELDGNSLSSLPATTHTPVSSSAAGFLSYLTQRISFFLCSRLYSPALSVQTTPLLYLSFSFLEL